MIRLCQANPRTEKVELFIARSPELPPIVRSISNAGGLPIVSTRSRAVSGLTERLAAVAEVVAALVVAEVLEQRGDRGFQSVDGPLAGAAKERLESRRQVRWD